MLKFWTSFKDLIIDCLSDHQQFFQIDDRKSPSRHVKFCITQVIKLGPTLFNVYVHDLTDHAHSSTNQFADDSIFYESVKATQVRLVKKL